MLNIDFTFVWVLVNLGILYLAVKKFLYNKLNIFMEERANAITKNIEDANRLKSDSEEILTKQQQDIQNSLLEAKQIIESAKINATKEQETIINNAKEEAKQIIDNAKKQAEQYYNKQVEDLKNDMADIAINLASKIISENMDTEKNRKLVCDFLANEEAC